jgi:hypothetical protein
MRQATNETPSVLLMSEKEKELEEKEKELKEKVDQAFTEGFNAGRD